MKWSFVLLPLATILLLQGCTSLVRDNLHHPDLFSVQISGATNEEILEFHHLERKRTTIDDDLTIDYLWGNATELTDGFEPPKLNFKMSWEDTPPGVDPVRHYRYQGKYRNPSVEAAKGLAILLHSYGADATSVYYESTALQLKGYNTVIVDLLGHGNNAAIRTSFGPADIERLHQLIRHLRASNEQPLLLYGKSYGASIAAQYAERYSNVDGLVLVAPMTHFTQAATRVSRATNPIIRTLISKQWLEQEIEQTLHDSAVSSDLISTPNVLKRIPNNTLPPTLVLFSEEDKISQPTDIAALKNLEKVKLVSLPKRRHIEMMVFDDAVDQHLYTWLEKFES